MLGLHFKEKRLWVGYRLRDWSFVWYEPIGKADDDGTAPIGLYSSVSGLETREPMEGEVAWLPPLEPTTFAAKTKRERERMQKQFIYDSWYYMDEKNPEAVAYLNQKMDQPKYTRWDEWFRVLKAEKVERRKRREHRMAVLKAADLNPEHADINSDVSDNEILPRRFQRLSVPFTPTSTPGRKRSSSNSQRGRRQRPRTSSYSRGAMNNDSGLPADPLDIDELFDASPPEEPSFPDVSGAGGGAGYGNKTRGKSGSHSGLFMEDDDEGNNA